MTILLQVSDNSQGPPLQHVGEPPYAQPHKLGKHVQQANTASMVSVSIIRRCSEFTFMGSSQILFGENFHVQKSKTRHIEQ